MSRISDLRRRLCKRSGIFHIEVIRYSDILYLLYDMFELSFYDYRKITTSYSFRWMFAFSKFDAFGFYNSRNYKIDGRGINLEDQTPREAQQTQRERERSVSVCVCVCAHAYHEFCIFVCAYV